MGDETWVFISTCLWIGSARGVNVAWFVTKVVVGEDEDGDG